MIDRKWIVRVPRQHLLELLHCPVIVEVVKMVERSQVLRVVRTEGQRFGVRIPRCGHYSRNQQKANQQDNDAAWKRERQFFLVRSLDFSLPEAGRDSPRTTMVK